jgi:hypothetical protein
MSNNRYSIPFCRDFQQPIYQPFSRVAELVLAAKSFMPDVSDRLIVGYVAECERLGGAPVDGHLASILADLQGYLATRNGRGEEHHGPPGDPELGA